ncbi:MAG: hypothetical protein Q9183_006904 [Haloplaca sp. 2 TL-2023]
MGVAAETSSTVSQASSTSRSSSSSSSTPTTTEASTTTSSTSSSSASSSSSTSKTVSTRYPTPSTTHGGTVYAGCANTTSPLALNALTLTSDSMDISTCTDYCTKNNYGLSGLQNGDTCFCGNGLQSYSLILEEASARDSKCNAPCAGNKTEICGAEKYLSVWNATTTVPPTMVKQVGFYPLSGCYNTTSAALNSTTTTASSITVESCVGYCNTRGYAAAGIENGNTCSCGESLNKVAEELELGECNVPCIANKREFCGGKKGSSLVYVLDSESVGNDGKPKSIGQKNEATIKAAA